MKCTNNDYIFVTSIPFKTNMEIYPESRLNEINNTTNEKVKSQKFFAWKLLEKAIHEIYDLNISDVNFNKTLTGKWVSDKFYFSISHTGDIVAIAISLNPIGVDVEGVENKKFSEKFRHKVLTENELLGNTDLSLAWTKKEAIFKRDNLEVFVPNKIDTCDDNLKSYVYKYT